MASPAASPLGGGHRQAQAASPSPAPSPAPAQQHHHHHRPHRRHLDRNVRKGGASHSDSAVHRVAAALVSSPPMPASSPFVLSRRRSSQAVGSPAAGLFRTIVDDGDDLIDDDGDEDDGAATDPPGSGWQPGSEPGYDPELPDGGHASVPALSAPCDITVVDFSLDRVVQRRFDNESFIAFLDQPKDDWAQCRWINVNGLSWDVIQAIGSKKGLHKLALEDVMNMRNRTKADWYPNHAFIVLTLQKLVHVVDADAAAAEADADAAPPPRSGSADVLRTVFGRLPARVRNLFRRKRRRNVPATPRADAAADEDDAGSAVAGQLEKGSPSSPPSPEHQHRHRPAEAGETLMLRSLQRYHASGNEARTAYMEKESPLARYNMAVSAEQVSIFLTNDNTAVSFFEMSAADVERPIVTRLSTHGTVLRESSDASMLVQAILDAIVDLAIPLTTVYSDLLGDLELDVLTAPSIRQSRSLYIFISEINKMVRFLQPIDNLVSVMRDHRTALAPDRAARELANPASGVIITPITHTYLGDVLDHCIIITEALQQLKQSSEDLISLIFNTISANQNESMRQLTTVTIIFLPLTFITGFFGQNFSEKYFPEIHNGIWYFWACAVPTAVATILILMFDMIRAWFVRLFRRKQILSIRRKARSSRRRRKQQ
ncbi:hypothetical protein CDD83_10046 [Cordyceps sp. RAO-2017]|nr:hypothetical protein CDD83_10046 [Cordyceps sp. RAO-2017]